MSLKKNILANCLGQGWSAVMGLAFIPLYIRYLGMEAYGLIARVLDDAPELELLLEPQAKRKVDYFSDLDSEQRPGLPNGV